MIGIGADPGSLGLLESLAGAWREPHRAYHTLQHLQECLDLLDAWVPAGETWARLGVALWFHDVVYDTRHPDSEERSIARARQLLTEAGTPAPAIEHVARLIEATKHSAATPSAADEHLMVDIDLSIFGASASRGPPRNRPRGQSWLRAARRWAACLAPRPAPVRAAGHGSPGPGPAGCPGPRPG